MSNNVEKYRDLDMMPTESLKTLLSLDIGAASGVELDADTVMHVMEVIQQRKEAEGTGPQIYAETAWKDFNENYRPKDEETHGLYNTDALENNVPKCAEAPNKKHIHLRRVVITVAAAAVLVVGGTVSANAAGIDLWRAIVEWASETFGFENNSPYEDPVAPQDGLACNDLQELLDTYGVKTKLVPTWLPDGFVQKLCNRNESPQMVRYQAMYEDSGKELTIQIFAYPCDACALETYEKLPVDCYEYEVNSITHYIACNSDGTVVAIWITDNDECSIYGDVTETEMKQIIDSIYGE